MTAYLRANLLKGRIQAAAVCLRFFRPELLCLLKPGSGDQLWETIIKAGKFYIPGADFFLKNGVKTKKSEAKS